MFNYFLVNLQLRPKLLKLETQVNQEDDPSNWFPIIKENLNVTTATKDSNLTLIEEYTLEYIQENVRFSVWLMKIKHLWHLHLFSGPFKCPECFRAFISVSNINQHVRDVHADESERLLEIVKKNVTNLRKANRTKEKEVAEKYSLKRVKLALEPIDISLYQCNQCLKTFSSIIKRIGHTCENVSHECDYCDRTFSMKCHLVLHTRSHTGERKSHFLQNH